MRLAVTTALLASTPELRAEARDEPSETPAARPVHEIDLGLGATWAGCYSSCRDEAAGVGFRLAYFYALSDPVSLGGGIDHARFSYGLSGGEPDTASTTAIFALFRVRPLQNPVADPYFELGLGLALEAAPASPHGPASTNPRAGAGLALGVPFLLTPALRVGPRFGGALTAGGRIGVSCVITSTSSSCEVYRTSHNGFLFAGVEAGLVFDASDLAAGP
jgi:hypothetical protein